jgi:hypothetical protein
VYVGDEPGLVPVAVKVTLVPAQTVVAEDAIETEAVWLGFMVKVVPVEVAVVFVKQADTVPPAVNTALTVWPFVGTKLKVVPVPWVAPFTFQAYVGAVPPFTPVAVKTTVVPVQTVVAVAAMETDAVRLELTVKVMPVEVAVVLARQVGNVPPAVSTAATVCPLDGVKVKVVPVPWAVPFTFQV